jgi:hypothetical protein
MCVCVCVCVCVCMCVVPLHFLSFFLIELGFIIIRILATLPTFFLLPEEKISKVSVLSSVSFLSTASSPRFLLCPKF